MRVNSLKAQDKLNDAGYAIKKQFAKSADALSDIARGPEAGAGGTLARKGTDFYGHVNDAHQASKAKIQESIQRVETGIETGKTGSRIHSIDQSSKTIALNPHEIRFSQNSVNGAEEIIESMKVNGWKGEPILML